MEFRCRTRELSQMEKRYSGGDFECIIIYGRRRVGKTALINKFCEDKSCIFFSAINATAKENLRSLSRSIYYFSHPQFNSFPEYASFDDAFAEITRIGEKERLIFVIDEYPYLAKADSSVTSKLQHLIDRVWQDSKIYLILCGSSMSFMQNQVLGYQSPLYGRRTAQFKIEPLDYRETAEFDSRLKNEEKACVFGITGGVPHYINKLNVKKNLHNALVENFFDTSAYLFEEPGNLLKQELREPAVYNSIITAIAEGSTRINEIATKTGSETAVVMKYMVVLMELGIVRKETPISEKPGKKTIYVICDELFRFWYRFVPRNMAVIASGKMPDYYDRMIKPYLHDYMGLVFEKMCRQYLMKYADDLPFDIADVGQWWGADMKTRSQVQIDIVGVPVRSGTVGVNEYIIGSCKFRNEKVDVDELELLRRYAAVFGKGEKYHYYIFSLGGFTQKLVRAAEDCGARLVSLCDMY